MTENKVKIIQAAIEVFSRYGVRRANMGDVAKAAGMSRQTLYANFAGKDELLAATMTSFIAQIMQDMETAWKNAETPSEIIEVYLKHAVYKPFTAMQGLPDLKELIKGVGGETENVAKQAEVDKATQLAKQLAPFADRLALEELTPLAIAQLFVRATNEFKMSSSDLTELEGLLRTLKASVLSLLRGPA